MTNLLVRLFVKDADNVKDPAVRTRYGKMAGWVGIVCNLLLAVGKLLAGVLSGSIAITADAVNNFSDASSSVITLVGFRLAAKPADEEHPFGHARSEYIAGLAVALLVLIVGVELGRGAVEKIISPEPVDYGWVSIAVLVGSILLKLWMAFFNRSIGRRIKSATLAATFADSRNDVIATSAVLAAALVARLSGLDLDGWMGLAVAVFIIVSGIGLVKETLDPLLGTAPDPALVKRLSDKLNAYPGVLGTHDLIVHDYGPGRRFASAHVEMASEEDVMLSHEIIDEMERNVLAQDNIHLIIHYDPVVTDAGATGDVRGLVARRMQEIDPRLTIHDLRVEDGGRHVHYIFDLVVPPDLEMSDDALREKVTQLLQHGARPVRVNVTIDRGFAPIPS